MPISDRMAEALKDSYQGLEKKITERTRDLSALYTALAPLASADSAQLLQQIVERLKEATGADAALIRIIDKETKSFLSPAQVGFSSDYLQATRNINAASAVRTTFMSGEPIIAADIARDTRLKGKRQIEAGFKSCAFLPLKVSGELRGIVHLASREIGHFSADKTEHLMAIARQMGVAMENRELFEESKKRTQEQAAQVKSLRLLVDASQKLVERVDIDTLAQDILQTVVTSFGIRLAWIGSAEADGRVKPLYWAGDVAEYLRHVEIRWDDSPLGHGPAGRAIRTGQPVVMDVATDPGFAPWRESALAHGYREVAAFPLMRGAKPFGHLILYSGEPGFFTPARIELLQTYTNIATAALENARMFDEARREARERAALNTIAAAVSQSFEMKEILKIAIDKVLEITGRERGYIRLKDPLTGEVTLAAHKGISEEYANTLLHGRTLDGKTDQVFQTGEPLVINDPEGALLKAATRQESNRSIAWIPMKAQGKVVGILNVSTAKPVPFTAREVELLQSIGNVIGVAVENAWLFEESQRQQEIQKLLKEISQDITSLDVNALFAKVADKVREFFKVDITDMRLFEEGGNRRIVGSSGIGSDRLSKLGTSRGRSGWMQKNRRPLVIADITKQTDIPAGDTTRELGVRGYLAVPLFSRSGEVMGILRAMTYEPREFSQSEIDLLQQLANGAAIALANTRLFEETQQRAHEQAVLSSIAQATSQSLHIDELLQISLDKVLEATGRERGFVRLKDPLTGELHLVAHRGISDSYAETLLHYRTPKGKSEQVFQTGEPLIVNDTEGTLLRDETRREGNGSIAWIPLKARGEVVGILNVSTAQPVPFSSREVELLKAIGNVIGVALENARLFEVTEQRAQEQAAVNAIAMAVSKSLKIEEILTIALDKVLEVTKRERGYIRLQNPATGEFLLGAHRGISEAHIANLSRGARPGGWSDQVFRSGEPIVLNNFNEESIWEETRRQGFQAMAWIPLKTRGTVVGILNVGTGRPLLFTPREVDLLQAIGNVIGVALENARLFKETERNLERIRALREIDQAISSTLDLRNVLDILLEKIDLSLPYATATIRLHNKENGRLEPVACRNLDEKEWKLEQWKAGRGIPNVVFETRTPLIIRNAQEDPRVLDFEFYRKHKLTSYVGVPMIVKDETLGVLGFYTKEQHDFSTEEVDFLSTLAGQAAIAIHNSQLYAEARTREAQLQETNRMLSGLHAVAAAASQSLDLDRVLHSAIEKITDIFAFDATQIHIFKDRTDELFLRAAFERDPDRFATVKSFRRGQGIVGKVAESGNPLIFEDVQNDPLYRQFSQSKISGQSGYRLFAVFPIRGKLRNLGTLACTGMEPRKLNPGEIQLLEAMTDQIAVAIENGELYEQLRQKIEELQQANKVKDEFLSVMSHELRTPLNIVMGYTAMIKDEMLGSVNTEQRRALEKVITRSNDLLNMITSILHATSIEAKEVRVQSTRFALPDLFDELKRIYDISLSKTITLNWDYPSDMPLLTLDRDKVRVVLQKIIDNATKFTERGRVAISVRVKEGGGRAPPKGLADQPRAETGKREDGEEPLSPHAFLEIKVKDNGVGISPEKLPIIFEMFRQADSSETRRFGGVGLGLYIAKHFVELMGGKIEVETEEGKGSIFTVVVPCLVSSSVASNQQSERQETAGHVAQIH